MPLKPGDYIFSWLPTYIWNAGKSERASFEVFKVCKGFNEGLCCISKVRCKFSSVGINRQIQNFWTLISILSPECKKQQKGTDVYCTYYPNSFKRRVARGSTFIAVNVRGWQQDRKSLWEKYFSCSTQFFQKLIDLIIASLIKNPFILSPSEIYNLPRYFSNYHEN